MQALAYLRTSSATNVGGDSDARQRAAIAAYATMARYVIEREFYDAAVSGADHVEARAGFAAMLAYAAETRVRTIIVENASRFARDLIVQETGYRMLTDRGFKLVAADSPEAFVSDTPTAAFVRQVLGAAAQLEKAMLVAKLKGARERRSAALGDACNGRGRSYAAGRPDLVEAARKLAPGRSLRELSATLAKRGYVTATGKPFSAAQAKRLATL